MATLLTAFEVPAASSMYTAMYIAPNGKLKLLIDIFTSSTVGDVTITNGYGGPSDNAIAFPWNQPVPLANNLNSYGVSTPLWSVDTTSYTPTALSSGRQQVEIIVNMSQAGQWLGVVVPANASQPATVNIYGETT